MESMELPLIHQEQTPTPMDEHSAEMKAVQEKYNVKEPLILQGDNQWYVLDNGNPIIVEEWAKNHPPKRTPQDIYENGR